MKGLKEDDKELLNLLQDDNACVPRITTLAHKLGLPTSTVKTKIDKLVKEGYVRGFSADLEPEKVGRGFTVFISAYVPLKKELDHVEDVAKEVSKIPEVLEIYYVSGEWDYLLKLRVRDREEYVRVVKGIGQTIGEFGGRAKGIVAYKALKDTRKLQVI